MCKRVNLAPPTLDYCEECGATGPLYDVAVADLPSGTGGVGTTTLCTECLYYEGHPEYDLPNG